MQYKMIYGVLHYDEDEDMSYDIVTPMLYDTRHNKTRERIIEQINQSMHSMIENRCEMRFGRCVEHAPGYNRYEDNNTNFLLDRGALFNQTNHLTQLASISYSEEDNNFYLYGSIYETTPEVFKTSESELSNFVESNERKYRFIDEHMYGDLMFKDIYFASRYVTIPDYDFDERYDYVGGFKAVSKNLYEFLKKETKDFTEQAKDFYTFSYREATDECPFEELRIHNELSIAAIARRNPVNLDNVIRRNATIYVDDGNGYYVSCSITVVPVVSYMGR